MIKNRRISLFLVLSSLLLVGCQGRVGDLSFDELRVDKQRDAVVYGEDSRKDDFNLQTATQVELSQKTFAIMPKYNLHQISEFFYLIQGRSLKETDLLCADESFSSQASAASCTATLVGPDLMLTAGHCFPRETSCEELVFTNQYGLKNNQESGHKLVDAKDIYQCKEVEYLSLERSSDNFDFAFIRLDRKVEDVEPVDLESARDPITFENIHNYSYPAGLPRKHIEGAIKDSGVDGLHFHAEIDTFVGSSGSMVYSVVDNSPLGILVGGAPDYVEDTEGQCQKVKVCAEGECKGERILKLTEINNFMKNLKAESLEDSAKIEDSEKLENSVSLEGSNTSSDVAVASEGQD